MERLEFDNKKNNVQDPKAATYISYTSGQQQ